MKKKKMNKKNQKQKKKNKEERELASQNINKTKSDIEQRIKEFEENLRKEN